MAQKIRKEKEEDLLVLGEKQEQVQIEETKKKEFSFSNNFNDSRNTTNDNRSFF